ncbi:reductase [Dissophora globulifera]|nr:reductase [Dissophora globulifera]
MSASMTSRAAGIILPAIRRSYAATTTTNEAGDRLVHAKPLANTLTLIPGGTRGIGLAVAKLFASKGSRVVILGRDPDRIQHVLNSELPPITPETNVDHAGFKCDVANREEVEDIVKEVVKIAPVDYLITSAGVAIGSLLVSVKPEDVEATMNINLMGTIWVNKAVVKEMLRQRKGSIVNISSVLGSGGSLGQTIYSASKGGVIAFSKALAKEVGSRGISVNILSPGYTETDMTQGLTEEKRTEIIARTSLGRLGQPDEIAEAALFLAQARFVTGQVLTVDGGLAL